MKVVIFLGPPGVGKGTQCSMLESSVPELVHISTGALIRNEIAKQSAFGLNLKKIVDAGNLVDDETILHCLESRVSAGEGLRKTIMLLDGIPRNINQAYMLDLLLDKLGYKLTKVIALTASAESLIERFARRWNCKSCGYVLSLTPQELLRTESLKCTNCGCIGTLYRRDDDNPETVKHRFQVYQHSTEPLLTHYAKKGLLVSIDGLRACEDVYLDVFNVVSKC